MAHSVFYNPRRHIIDSLFECIVTINGFIHHVVINRFVCSCEAKGVTLLELMVVFFSVGLFTIGGGLVSIPLLFNAFVVSGVLSIDMFYQLVSIAESTPGPIAINLATYLGFVQHGWFGAMLATTMFVLPAYVLLEWFYPWYLKHQHIPFLIIMMNTLKITVIALIGLTLLRVMEHIVDQQRGSPLQGLLVFSLLSVFYGVNQKRPLLLVGMGALLGVIFFR